MAKSNRSIIREPLRVGSSDLFAGMSRPRTAAASIEGSLKGVDPRRADVNLRRFDRDHGEWGLRKFTV